MLPRATCEVDLDAIAANVEVLRAHAPGSAVLAVVKADAYGHGLVPAARAALAGGADWLGTALLAEAVALRQAGIAVPILAWLWAPQDADLAEAVLTGVDVTASAGWQLEACAAAARGAGVRARVQLKVDTGLARNGASATDWPALVEQAAALERAGTIRVTGIWSHFALADAPSSATNAEQLGAFRAALDVAGAAGLTPQVRHIANSAATLAAPAAHFDLVRPGIAVYGVSPGGELGRPERYGLRPAMTLRARLALVKRVPGGQGVSYGHEYVTPDETTLGLVPLGYADGIPRAAGGRGPVLAAGRIRRVAGRVCMDQFVLDLGDDRAGEGDEVVLFGSAARGEPTAEDWAVAAGTIGYEIITRLGPRVHRTWVGTGA
ncbi:MAG: alanine racemase [Candidatus Nanopelagicales bacterium]|nr:alanine racemase [Candidatus Nanopelagicales bacterium]